MQMRLKLFHEAKAPLANGHRRDTLLLLSDEEFENNQGFIQWAFPTPTPSKNPTDAPILDLGSAFHLSKDKDFVIFIENMTARFLEFLKRNDHWKRKYNHNHLRISRALESIRVLHSYELSDWFLKQSFNSAKKRTKRCLTHIGIGNRIFRKVTIELLAHSLD